MGVLQIVNNETVITLEILRIVIPRKYVNISALDFLGLILDLNTYFTWYDLMRPWFRNEQWKYPLGTLNETNIVSYWCTDLYSIIFKSGCCLFKSKWKTSQPPFVSFLKYQRYGHGMDSSKHFIMLNSFTCSHSCMFPTWYNIYKPYYTIPSHSQLLWKVYLYSWGSCHQWLVTIRCFCLVLCFPPPIKLFTYKFRSVMYLSGEHIISW